MNPRKLKTLTAVLEEFAVSPIPSHIFQVVADFAPALVSHDYLGLCLPDESPDRFRVHTLGGSTAPPDQSFATGTSLCDPVLRGGKTLRKSGLSKEELEPFPGFTETSTALISPIKQGGEVIGAITFGSHRKDAFDENDAVLAEALGAAIGSSLQNSRLYQELSDDRLTLRAVLSASRDAFLLVNPEGTLLMANPAAAPLLTVDTESAIGQSIEKVLNNEEVRNLFNGETESMEVAFGDERVAQATVFPVESEYGETLGFSAVFRDVTTLKQLDAMKSEFVHTVSHDLKGPIGSLMLGIELVKRGTNLSAKQRRQMDRMEKTMDDMKRLVENLLDLGKLEAERNERRDTVDLASIAQESITILGSNHKCHHIKIKTDNSPTQAAVDPEQMRQVFDNLISNSIKYSPEGGVITISFSNNSEALTSPHLSISISDQGIGVPEKDLPHLFERFYRSESPDHRSTSGTGLGLAIVKKIIESHQGSIEVDSDGKSGTCFKISLPITAS